MNVPAKKQLAKITMVLTILFLNISPAPAAMIQFQDAPVVTQDHLDSMRGGFVTRNHGLISLGITKVINIDGVLKVTNSLHVPDMSQLTNRSRGGMGVVTGAANRTVSISTVPASATSADISTTKDGLIEVGASDVPVGKSMLVMNDGFSTLIQNGYDQKTIQSLTIIDATVANSRLIREINLMHRINEQMIGAMR